MNKRVLVGIWKMNFPPAVWIKLPLWIALIIIGLDGRAPDWDELALLFVTVPLIISILEFANRYADKDEDRIYFPGNPLSSGELDVETAKKALIVQNIICGLLLIALSVVSLNYALIAALFSGWFIALAYSLPPFKLKQTLAAPLVVAFGDGLQSIAAWLSVASLNKFIIAFAIFWFVFVLGQAITIKLRKTSEAVNRGMIRVEEGNSVYNLKIVDLKLRVKTAVALEIIPTLGAFILVPIFWHLGIFSMTLSILLLTLPLVFTIASVFLRVKDPLGNGMKCVICLTMAWIFIMLSLLGYALTSYIHWGFAISACIVVLIVALLLFRTIQTYELKAIAAPWREI